MTLAQVSKRTRIRETIIRKIEADDFSECGGDFYARGHIRAIAKAVGTDPEPLIEDYDTDHRATGPMATVSLDELLATSAPQRHRPDLPAAWARVTAASAPVARKASAGAGAVRGRVASGRGPGPRTARWAVFVCLALMVVALGFVALHVLAGVPPAAAPSAAGKHAATSHNAGHGRPGPAAKSSHRRHLPRHRRPVIRRRRRRRSPSPRSRSPRSRRRRSARTAATTPSWPTWFSAAATRRAGTPTGTTRPGSGTCTRARACC